MTAYKSKIVCFIDILGFGTMVTHQFKGKPEGIHSILSIIDTLKEEWNQQPITSGTDLQITQFSDSIVVSFLPIKHYIMNFDFFKKLSVRMIDEGILLRGGITYGEIFHDNSFVFGPAMNDAYYLESEEAIFPRIILDEKVMQVKNDDGKTIADYYGQFLIKIEAEDYSFVDYLIDVLGYVDQESYYEKLRALILSGLNHERDSVREKYQWLKIRYNLAKTQFPALLEI